MVYSFLRLHFYDGATILVRVMLGSAILQRNLEHDPTDVRKIMWTPYGTYFCMNLVTNNNVIHEQSPQHRNASRFSFHIQR